MAYCIKNAREYINKNMKIGVAALANYAGVDMTAKPKPKKADIIKLIYDSCDTEEKVKDFFDTFTNEMAVPTNIAKMLLGVDTSKWNKIKDRFTITDTRKTWVPEYGYEVDVKYYDLYELSKVSQHDIIQMLNDHAEEVHQKRSEVSKAVAKQAAETRKHRKENMPDWIANAEVTFDEPIDDALVAELQLEALVADEHDKLLRNISYKYDDDEKITMSFGEMKLNLYKNPGFLIVGMQGMRQSVKPSIDAEWAFHYDVYGMNGELFNNHGWDGKPMIIKFPKNRKSEYEKYVADTLRRKFNSFYFKMKDNDSAYKRRYAVALEKMITVPKYVYD